MSEEEKRAIFGAGVAWGLPAAIVAGVVAALLTVELITPAPLPDGVKRKGGDSFSPLMVGLAAAAIMGPFAGAGGVIWHVTRPPDVK